MAPRLVPAIAIVLGLAGCGDDGGGTPRDGGIDATCDQQLDPTCCGAIDHDCLGGACVAGVCQPVVLASEVNVPDLAIAGDALYFVEPIAGLIERMGTDGSGRTTIATSPDTPVAVAASAAAVVWATLGALPHDGAIVRLATGETVPVTISTMEHVPGDFAIDAAGVVWTNYGSGSMPYAPGELRALPEGGAATTIEPTLNHACGVALAGTTVYYTTFGTSVVNPVDGAVTFAPRAGGSPLTVATNRHGPRFVVVTGSHIYWTEEGTMNASYMDGRVMRMERSGGLPEVLADEVRPHGLFADGDFVYWLAGDATVRRLALADRTKTAIATVPGRPLTVIVADDRALYFLAGPDAVGGTGGQIIKLAR